MGMGVGQGGISSRLRRNNRAGIGLPLPRWDVFPGDDHGSTGLRKKWMEGQMGNWVGGERVGGQAQECGTVGLKK